MATYISLLSLTEQGIKTIKDLPGRIAAGRQAMEAAGGKLVQYYLTLGAQDAVVVFELPDDETAASLVLAQAGLGNLRSTTMRAFTEAEIPGVLSKLPKAIWSTIGRRLVIRPKKKPLRFRSEGLFRA